MRKPMRRLQMLQDLSFMQWELMQGKHLLLQHSQGHGKKMMSTCHQ